MEHLKVKFLSAPPNSKKTKMLPRRHEDGIRKFCGGVSFQNGGGGYIGGQSLIDRKIPGGGGGVWYCSN